jgi:hypothetical protein
MEQSQKQPTARAKGARRFWKSVAGRKQIKRLRDERTGRSQPKNFGRTGPIRKIGGHGAAAPTWEIARLLTSGHSAEEAASKLGMERRALADRAKKAHLNYGSIFICDQGIPFRDEKLTAIRGAAGFLTAPQSEKALGLRPGSCGPRKGGPKAIRVPEVARTVIAWRDKAIRALAEFEGDKFRSYRNYEIVHTLLPDLGPLRDALVETFAAIHSKFGPDWEMDDVWNFVTERARGGASSSWHRTLCYLWEIEPALKRRFGEFAGSDPRTVRSFILEILGERYGVHRDQIEFAIRGGRKSARTIQPAEMFRLISSALPSVRTSTSAPIVRQDGMREGGKKRGFVSDDSNDRILLIAALETKGTTTTYGMAPLLYPLTARRTRTAAENATRKFRKRHALEIAKARQSMDAPKANGIIATIHPK